MFGDRKTAKDRLKKTDNKARRKAIYKHMHEKKESIAKEMKEKKLSGNYLFD